MSSRVAQLTATKRERIRREQTERVRRGCERPAVRAKLLAMADRYFKEKFEKVWPHIRKGSRMDREAAWVAFLAGVVACRAYEQDPPPELRRLLRQLAKAEEAKG